MTKTLATALACTLLLGACSSIKPAEEPEALVMTDSADSTKSGDAP